MSNFHTFKPLATLHAWKYTLVGLLGFVLAYLSLSLVKVGEDNIAGFWSVNGALLGLALIAKDHLGEKIYWSGLFGALLACLMLEETWTMALGLMTANLVEVSLIYHRLKKVLVDNKNNLGHPKVLRTMTGHAVFLGPLMSAALAFPFLEHPDTVDPWILARNWFAAHAIGNAIFLPLMWIFHKDVLQRLYLVKSKLLVRGSVLALVTWLMFYQGSYPFLFIPMLPLAWLVFGVGLSGSIVGVFIMMVIGFVMNDMGFTPVQLFTSPGIDDQHFVLHVWLGSTLALGLPIGMLLDHRRGIIRKLKERELELEHMANHDPLTGLLNRRGFEPFMEQAQIQKQGVLMLVDIDFFKRYNDTYGHDAGDECLKKVASTLRTSALPWGGHVSRQGGEEFGVLLPGTNANQASLWWNSLQQLILSNNIEHRGSPLQRVTLSAGGIVLCDVHEASTLKTPLQKADEALYKAKEQGRNQMHVWGA